VVDVGLVHLAEELAGVGGEALDVAALALGVDRVESQRGLAAPGEARYDDHHVPRQGDGHVLQVVLARPPHDDLVIRDGPSPLL
jgi:hypothetical protein